METRFSSFEQINLRLEMLQTQRQLSLYRLKKQLQVAPVEILKTGWRYGVVPSLKSMALAWSLNKLRHIRSALSSLRPRKDLWPGDRVSEL